MKMVKSRLWIRLSDESRDNVLQIVIEGPELLEKVDFEEVLDILTN